MTPAPPPPPIKNLQNFSTSKISNLKKANIPNTSALLKSIEKGAKLKKTITNDRSAPQVPVQSDKLNPNKYSTNSITSKNESNSSNLSGLNGIFANGFPTLKSKVDSEKVTSLEKNELLIPKMMKKPAEKIVKNLSNEMFRDPEKSFVAIQKGSKLTAKVVAPVIISAANGDDADSVNRLGKNLANLAISKASESDRWKFPENAEKILPTPLKYNGYKKIYLSQTNIINSKISANTQVSNDDIDGFIKNLKSKLNNFAAEENFEECVRLKSKLKSFDIVKKRIKSGERVYASELPR